MTVVEDRSVASYFPYPFINLSPFSFAIAALLYSVFGVVIEKARGAEDDINTVAAGTLTGMLFKSGGRCH